MKIEIWSDVMCPFCYIGKRHFEEALLKFNGSEQIDIEWKSFQLDPSMPTVAAETQEEYLVKRKGMSREQVQAILQNVTVMAKKAGLTFNLNQAVMVNSQMAHRLIQFAKSRRLGSEIEERLFKAYFTEGKNLADSTTLTTLGKEIGLEENEIQAAFKDDKYLYQMKQDIQESQNIGVRGVPFFVFDRKYGVSGAQPAEAFLETLDKSFTEWREKNPKTILDISKGQSCDINGNCD